MFHGLGILHMIVYWTLAQYRETGSMKDRPRSDHPHDIRAWKRIHAVRERIRRNPLRKQKVMSQDMNNFSEDHESYSQ